MNNLFNQEDAGDIVVRLSHLSPGKTPLWGKMSVAQMLAHCQQPLKVSLGEHQVKPTIIGWLFGRMAKRQMLKEKTFKKNLPTVASFIIKDNRDFITELQKLEALIERFTAANQQSVAARKHPFFGRMTPEEWGILNWKHLDHHLRQSGV